MIQITGRNAPEAYTEAWWCWRGYPKTLEDSRNGPVEVFNAPVFLTIHDPVERVIFDPVRDANPFFHVMEFVWMLAGSNDANWLGQFNKRMLTYADDGRLRGAYGWRWANPTDQIAGVIGLLRRDRGTRQAVISMWDPVYDGPEARTSDRPCNTHIYFRSRAAFLDMTVCNRSNDLVWGMLGANVVHMTFLQELVALAAGFEVGRYQVFTNNLHVYKDVPRHDELVATMQCYDPYGEFRPFPLLNGGETWEDLREDCKDLLTENGAKNIRTQWMVDVAWPMYRAYLSKTERNGWIQEIKADDWKRACEQWVARRSNDSAGSTISVQG